jgi:hypothetical protein
MQHRSKGIEDGEVIDVKEQRNEVCCRKNEKQMAQSVAPFPICGCDPLPDEGMNFAGEEWLVWMRG